MDCDKSEKTTASEKVYNELKGQILNEKYLPGEHLVEADLVAEHKCSRATIREALRGLIDDGLVELIPHKGIVVRKLTKKQIIDICEVLYCLQPLLGRLTIQECDEEKCKLLENEITKLDDLDYRAYFNLVVEFNLKLAEFTKNLMLIREMAYIYTLLRVNYRLINFEFKREFLLVCRGKILEALKNRDEELVIKLLSDSVKSIIASIEKYY